MAFQSTTGIGVPLRLTVDSNFVTLSLSGVNTHQINATITDLPGTVLAQGTSFVLTAAANATGGLTTYTGTITGGGSNAFADLVFTIAGFDLTANNGTFLCTSSSETTLTLDNGAGVADTHAATAFSEEVNPISFVSYSAQYATVSPTGLITGIAKGEAVLEVCYPFANNTIGNIAAGANNVMTGTPTQKIRESITVQVTL
jgi:hypothetical protein